MQTATLSKKVVSVLLSLALIFSFTPTLAFAENSNLGENSANQNTAEEGSSTGANDNALNDSENQGNNSASDNSSNQTANNDNSSDSSNIDSGTGLVRSNEVNQKGTTDNPADQQDSASEEAAETNNNEADDKANSWRYVNGEQIYSYEGASTDGDVSTPGISPFSAEEGASSYATWYKSNGTTSYTYKAEPDDAGQNISVSGAKRVGIDVSYHNGTIDWAKVKNSGVSFAIIRCGYGSDFTSQDDVKFFENVRGAQENGIDIGIYLYSYAMNTTGNDSSAASEARHVLRLLDEAGLEPNDLAYPVFFDMEESKQLDLGSKKLGELASTFCNAISAEGYEVGIYSNLNWWSNYLTDSAFDNSNWHKWAARYPGSNKATSSGVPGTEIWQFSDCGHVDGVNGNVDMNFDYVGKSEEARLILESETNTVNYPIKIQALTNQEGCAYKFVWYRDSWDNWGVAQQFSDKSEISYIPEKPGNYGFVVDIKWPDGKVTSIEKRINIYSWGLSADSLTVPESIELGESAELNTEIIGEASDLKYSYYYQKDGSNQWSEIAANLSNPLYEWMPDIDGVINIKAVVEDEASRSVEKIKQITISNDWEISELVCEDGEEIEFSKNCELNFKATTKGNSYKKQYKFVWEKDNWADWGTIQNFSDNSTCTWMPTEAGTYNLYVDVRDATGKVQSTSIQVKLTEKWSFDSITVTPTTSNVVGDQATIAVNTSGNNSSLQYKFVWEKNNWADWGTIQNFSDNPTCTWIPSQSGTYTFYVDIKDSTGKVTSKTYTYKVGTIGLNVEGSSTQEYKPGMEVELTTYAPQGTQYKFVWEKDNWADWGTIQNFSDNSTCTWMPTEAGTYNLYVDVRDATGKVQSTSIQVKLTEKWSFDSITVTPTTSNVVGDQATIAVNTSGNNSSLQYKFVWEKNNWADWGTIQNFSDNPTCTWIPSQSGTYTFYVDIKDSTGKVTSKTYTYNVN